MASSSRYDGRDSMELRPVSIKLNQLSRADGSARFGFGERLLHSYILPTGAAESKELKPGSTAALASFSGPIEVRLRDEQPEKATLEIVHRPLQGVGDTSSRALEGTLTAILTPILHLSAHPRSLVQIVVQSLSTPSHTYSASSPSYSNISASHTWPASEHIEEEAQAGPSRISPMAGLTMGEKAAAINAVTVSALDAGSVGLRGVPVAVSLAVIPRRTGDYFADTNGTDQEEGVLVLDPTEEEERNAIARAGFAWVRGVGLSSEGGSRAGGEDENMDGDGSGEMEMVWSEMEGEFSRHNYNEALSLSRGAAIKILDEIRTKLAEKFTHR